MSALLDELDDELDGHECDQTLRVHTLIDGHFSSYACSGCADAIQSIALKHLPTATDLVVSERAAPSPSL